MRALEFDSTHLGPDARATCARGLRRRSRVRDKNQAGTSACLLWPLQRLRGGSGAMALHPWRVVRCFVGEGSPSFPG